MRRLWAYRGPGNPAKPCACAAASSIRPSAYSGLTVHWFRYPFAFSLFRAFALNPCFGGLSGLISTSRFARIDTGSSCASITQILCSSFRGHLHLTALIPLHKRSLKTREPGPPDVNSAAAMFANMSILASRMRRTCPPRIKEQLNRSSEFDADICISRLGAGWICRRHSRRPARCAW